jgi:hypothetical protein
MPQAENSKLSLLGTSTSSIGPFFTIINSNRYHLYVTADTHLQNGRVSYLFWFSLDPPECVHRLQLHLEPARHEPHLMRQHKSRIMLTLPLSSWVNRENRVPYYQRLFQEGSKQHTRQWLQVRPSPTDIAVTRIHSNHRPSTILQVSGIEEADKLNFRLEEEL